ncbi:hypothetical protein PGIGA_G00077760 [Pangasianodon gigas]|uniref:Uncharacterized protein n=1 Tax=Pangasianodon gigas TaxID=30993 RepID=A0ACC5X902_PANGG|nr:hypothetical protein [Pangasianodon gigas]
MMRLQWQRAQKSLEKKVLDFQWKRLNQQRPNTQSVLSSPQTPHETPPLSRRCQYSIRPAALISSTWCSFDDHGMPHFSRDNTHNFILTHFCLLLVAL